MRQLLLFVILHLFAVVYCDLYPNHPGHCTAQEEANIYQCFLDFLYEDESANVSYASFIDILLAFTLTKDSCHHFFNLAVCVRGGFNCDLLNAPKGSQGYNLTVVAEVGWITCMNITLGYPTIEGVKGEDRFDIMSMYACLDSLQRECRNFTMISDNVNWFYGCLMTKIQGECPDLNRREKLAVCESTSFFLQMEVADPSYCMYVYADLELDEDIRNDDT